MGEQAGAGERGSRDPERVRGLAGKFLVLFRSSWLTEAKSRPPSRSSSFIVERQVLGSDSRHR